MLKHNDENFEVYPVDKLVAIMHTKEDADRAVEQLIKSGFKEETIDESYGKEGLMFLDPDAEQHGLLNGMIRQLQMSSMKEVFDYVKRIKTGLEHGHVVLTVPAKDDLEIEKAGKIVQRNNADDARFYGKDKVETIVDDGANLKLA